MTEQEEDVLRQLIALIDPILEGQKFKSTVDFSQIENESLKLLSTKVLALSNQYNETAQFVLDLSQGKLNTKAPIQNSFVSPFKQVQAELLHLTWQIHQISKGDLEQKVSFSGDFSDSINRMILSLREKDEIGKLNVQYLEELKELNATKDRFFSIIAHDLKNPFYGLLGMSDVLLELVHSKQTQDLEAYILQVKASAESGYRLLLNLLEWSSIQTGRLNVVMQAFDVCALVDEVVALASTTANAKQIRLEVECKDSFRVMGDPNALKTVLRNLISNALKFTHVGGLVRVGAHRDGSKIKFYVIDNGVGMTKEVQSKLFRLDVSVSTFGTQKERGTGLGLILCKELLAKMHTNVAVESEPEKGSGFSFTLESAEYSS